MRWVNINMAVSRAPNRKAGPCRLPSWSTCSDKATNTRLAHTVLLSYQTKETPTSNLRRPLYNPILCVFASSRPVGPSFHLLAEFTTTMPKFNRSINQQRPWYDHGINGPMKILYFSESLWRPDILVMTRQMPRRLFKFSQRTVFLVLWLFCPVQFSEAPAHNSGAPLK